MLQREKEEKEEEEGEEGEGEGEEGEGEGEEGGGSGFISSSRNIFIDISSVALRRAYL
jgi:hypothetical protein